MGFEEEFGLQKKIDRTQLANYLETILKDISLEDFAKLFINEFQATIDYYKLSNNEKSGQKITLLFNPHRINTSSVGNKISLYGKLQDPLFYSNLVRVLFLENYDLYQTCALGVGGTPIIADFPPHVMRDYCKQFHLNKESKILDPCAGWGGRMIGASVVCNNYTCFDPSTKTYNGLIKLYKWLKGFNDNFNADINKLPFEDSKLERESFDFALTSPPYYNTEKYSDEETNSLNRYKTFDEWTNGFYIPLIKKTMKALKQNCTFVLNIGSRKYPLNQILLDNFSSIYEISKLHGKLSASNGLGKKGEGETFYAIKKT
jgi:16S rRNA G966 N2-methylase RsmD